MKKIVEIFENNKKTILVTLLVALSLILFILGFMFFFKEETKEIELKNLLKEMGQDYYENYYYSTLNKTPEEKENYLKEQTNNGIEINLDNLVAWKETNETKLKEFINPKTNQTCDKEETKVIIYPNKDFKKEDYTMEVIISCGFETKKEISYIWQNMNKSIISNEKIE